jgi:hypothetical protein
MVAGACEIDHHIMNVNYGRDYKGDIVTDLKLIKVGDKCPVCGVRSRIGAAGGHATQFRDGDRRTTFHPLPPALAAIHRRLKFEFDPAGVFNPGRLYPEF